MDKYMMLVSTLLMFTVVQVSGHHLGLSLLRSASPYGYNARRTATRDGWNQAGRAYAVLPGDSPTRAADWTSRTVLPPRTTAYWYDTSARGVPYWWNTNQMTHTSRIPTQRRYYDAGTFVRNPWIATKNLLPGTVITVNDGSQWIELTGSKGTTWSDINRRASPGAGAGYSWYNTAGDVRPSRFGANARAETSRYNSKRRVRINSSNINQREQIGWSDTNGRMSYSDGRTGVSYSDTNRRAGPHTHYNTGHEGVSVFDASRREGVSVSDTNGYEGVSMFDANGREGTGVSVSDVNGLTGVSVSDANERAGVSVSDANGRAGVSVSNANERAGVSLADAIGLTDRTVSDANGRAGVPVSDVNGRAGVSMSDANGRESVAVSDANGRAGVSVSDVNGRVGVSWSDASGRTGVSLTDANGRQGVSVSDVTGRTGVSFADADGFADVPVSDVNGLIGVSVSDANSRAGVSLADAHGFADVPVSNVNGLIGVSVSDANSHAGVSLADANGFADVSVLDANGRADVSVFDANGGAGVSVFDANRHAGSSLTDANERVGLSLSDTTTRAGLSLSDSTTQAGLSLFNANEHTGISSSNADARPVVQTSNRNAPPRTNSVVRDPLLSSSSQTGTSSIRDVGPQPTKNIGCLGNPLCDSATSIDPLMQWQILDTNTPKQRSQFILNLALESSTQAQSDRLLRQTNVRPPSDGILGDATQIHTEHRQPGVSGNRQSTTTVPAFVNKTESAVPGTTQVQTASQSESTTSAVVETTQSHTESTTAAAVGTTHGKIIRQSESTTVIPSRGRLVVQFDRRAPDHRFDWDVQGSSKNANDAPFDPLLRTTPLSSETNGRTSPIQFDRRLNNDTNTQQQNTSTGLTEPNRNGQTPLQNSSVDPTVTSQTEQQPRTTTVPNDISLAVQFDRRFRAGTVVEGTSPQLDLSEWPFMSEKVTALRERLARVRSTRTARR